MEKYKVKTFEAFGFRFNYIEIPEGSVTLDFQPFPEGTEVFVEKVSEKEVKVVRVDSQSVDGIFIIN